MFRTTHIVIYINTSSYTTATHKTLHTTTTTSSSWIYTIVSPLPLNTCKCASNRPPGLRFGKNTQLNPFSNTPLLTLGWNGNASSHCCNFSRLGGYSAFNGLMWGRDEGWGKSLEVERRGVLSGVVFVEEKRLVSENLSSDMERVVTAP